MSVRVLICDDQDLVRDGLEAILSTANGIETGAAGFLLKDTLRDQLVAAIKGTAAGRSYLDPAVAGDVLSRVSRTAAEPTATSLTADLSEREQDVLRLLGRGLSNSAIAEQLYLSEGTVRNYVSAILTKLDVADRTQAAVLAVRHGVV